MTNSDMPKEYTELMLAAWGELKALRDPLVRDAHIVGISKYRIHLLSGIARSTIDRIIKNG